MTIAKRGRCNVAGFIEPYKCFEADKYGSLDPAKKMRVKKARLRLSPNEEAALVREETERRRKLRLQQVREQCKQNAANIRHAVKHEKHKQLMKLATEIKSQLEDEKAERVRHLEQQYDNSLRNIGIGHRDASEQPDWAEEKQLVQFAENLRAESRGRAAMEKLKWQTDLENQEAQRVILARKHALEVEKERSAEIAAMPPPPPDPLKLANNIKPSKPVKVMDMHTYSSSHYHMANDLVVDRADPGEGTDAREAAGLEHERITQRALELQQLRHDQLERARIRHNAALEKEILKHDYDNILHDLSDLQRADRGRRLQVVHNIPKQVFEPPNFRLEDREDRQKQMEQDFEDMYMAGTDYLGEISMALDPHPHPATPAGEDSLDVTGTSTTGLSPLQEPTLPTMPPVLQDMTNMPRAKSPGKKPKKVLRNLMDRIKSQREEWITSHSLVEVGEGEPDRPARPLPDMGMLDKDVDHFRQLTPQELSPPEKLARVHSPEPVSAFHAPMSPEEFAEKLRMTQQTQQTNVQLQPPGRATRPQIQQQQIELAEILKQQEMILEQRRQMELKLEQLNHQQQSLQAGRQLSDSQLPPAVPQPALAHIQQPLPSPLQPGYVQQPQFAPLPQVAAGPTQLYQPVAPTQPVFPQQPIQQVPMLQPQECAHQPTMVPSQIPQYPQIPTSVHQQFITSVSSTGLSPQPMNSIPPTHTTTTLPMATTGQGQPPRMAYQQPSAVMTTDQLAPSLAQGIPQHLQNGYGPPVQQQQPQVTMATSMSMLPSVTAAPLVNGVGGVVPGDAHSEQMKRVKEYQQYLLARHEQSKKVLAETKAEIQRRRENLLQRYPKLDLSRMEGLGAKYLEDQTAEQLSQGQGQIPAQGQSVPVTSLLASLANHPYYASSLTKPVTEKPLPNGDVSIGPADAYDHEIHLHPDINLDTNLRTNKLDGIRKSLPFDADGSYVQPSPAVAALHDLYKGHDLDTTSGTDADTTTTSTERGSPELPPSARQFAQLDESSDLDTTASTMTPEHPDPATVRQEQLRRQLVEIQRQKEEIMKLHQIGEERVLSKEEQLKAKLAAIMPDELGHSLRESIKQRAQETISTSEPPPTSTIPAPTTSQDDGRFRDIRRHDLSTIHEVDTPASGKPSEKKPGRSSLDSSDGSTSSSRSKKSLEFSRKEKAIAEEPSLENVATQMEKTEYKGQPEGEVVATYSGSNIANVLERAKRFETEVLEKLRKQTNAVLFNQDFDDSLEFDVSRRQVAPAMSSGSLSPLSDRDSFSTGPIDDSLMSKSRDLLDTRSTNGSFQSMSKSWAHELAAYKIPPSNESDLPFKVMVPERMSAEKDFDFANKPLREDSVFVGDVNRFKVYSKINGEQKDDKDTSEEIEKPRKSEDKIVPPFTAAILDSTTVNATDMLKHLKDLQQELRDSEETRKVLEEKLLDRKITEKAADNTTEELSEYSITSDKSEKVSRPFMPKKYTDTSTQELSQYSLHSDLSSSSSSDQSSDRSRDEPIQSGTRSIQREMPVRRSPIGDHMRAESPAIAGAELLASAANRRPEQRQEVTQSEYSFAVTDEKQMQRSTSTPGEDQPRRKSAIRDPAQTTDAQTTITSRSELPSEITINDKTAIASPAVRFNLLPEIHKAIHKMSAKSPADGSDLTTFSVSSTDETDNSVAKKFQQLIPEKVSSKKTYSVSFEGDLVSEQSDSDISRGNSQRVDSRDDFSTYSISTQADTTVDSKAKKYDVASGLSTYSIPEDDSSFTPGRMSDYSYKSSLQTDLSGESLPKSSSLTTVTSDPSYNFSETSSLSQHTLKSDAEDDNFVRLSEKSDDLNNSNSDSSSNYVQEKFASLDNLIMESKNLIARHKVIIDKNKQLEDTHDTKMEDAAKPPSPEESFAPGEIIPALPSAPPPFLPKTKPLQTYDGEDLSKTESSFGPLSSTAETTDLSITGYDTTPAYRTDTSAKTKDISSSFEKTAESVPSYDVSSLDYLVEHSSGITEEPEPDLAAGTLGSEISLIDTMEKTNNSDSTDSLHSFEKHEMSGTDTFSSSQFQDEDSLVGRSASIQEMFDQRRQNFIAQSGRRAEAAKEKALSTARPRRDDGMVFRAVPVSVVAEPHLSMAMNVDTVDRGRSPTQFDVKSQPAKEPKLAQDVKETEIKASGSTPPLNRALLPRGGDGAKPSLPETDGGARPKDKKSASGPVSDNQTKAQVGQLAGEVRQFGGSSGLGPKPSPKKIPPKVLPKPVRHKPSQDVQDGKAVGGMSKTVSSWKKSRTVKAPPAVPVTLPPTEPSGHKSLPKDSVKVLPKVAPPPLTEEERRLKAEREVYARNMRAYNPRLFRLQFQMEDTEDEKQQQQPPPQPVTDRGKKEDRDSGSHVPAAYAKYM